MPRPRTKNVRINIAIPGKWKKEQGKALSVSIWLKKIK